VEVVLRFEQVSFLKVFSVLLLELLDVLDTTPVTEQGELADVVELSQHFREHVQVCVINPVN
jgi:hypothetical protein